MEERKTLQTVESPNGGFRFVVWQDEDGVVHGKSSGRQDAESGARVIEALKEVRRLCGEPYAVVFDISELTEIDPASRRVFAEYALATGDDVRKIAIVGGSFFMRNVIGLFARLTKPNMRMFATEPEALAWLRREDDR